MDKNLKTGLTILGCVAGGVAIGFSCYYLGKNYGWILEHLGNEAVPAHTVNFSAPIEYTTNGYITRLEDILVATMKILDRSGEAAKNIIVVGEDGSTIGPITDFLYNALQTVGITV